MSARAFRVGYIAFEFLSVCMCKYSVCHHFCVRNARSLLVLLNAYAGSQPPSLTRPTLWADGQCHAEAAAGNTLDHYALKSTHSQRSPTHTHTHSLRPSLLITPDGSINHYTIISVGNPRFSFHASVNFVPILYKKKHIMAILIALMCCGLHASSCRGK